MPDYEVRRPGRADAEQMAILHARVWRETYADLMDRQAWERLSPETSLPMWQTLGAAYDSGQGNREARDNTERQTWIALVAGEPVGFIAHGPPRGEGPPVVPAELYALNVVAEHQGQGLALRLLDDYGPVGPAFLWVARGNDRAIAFYRRNGYELDGVEEWEEQVGMMHLRMVRAA